MSAAVMDFCCPHCGESVLPPVEEPLLIGNVAYKPSTRELSGPAGSTTIGSRGGQILVLGAKRLNQVIPNDTWLGVMNMWDLEACGLTVAVHLLRQELKRIGADIEIRNFPRRGYGLFMKGAPPPLSLPAERSAGDPGNGDYFTAVQMQRRIASRRLSEGCQSK